MPTTVSTSLISHLYIFSMTSSARAHTSCVVVQIVQCLTGKEKGYLHDFENRWQNDEILGGRFDIVGRGRRGLRRHRDMSITDAESGGAYDSIETSDDGSGFE